MNCERWDTIFLPSEHEGCPYRATHSATYADGVTLELCTDHADDAEGVGAEVTPHKSAANLRNDSERNER